jgi:predicted P-loop ATPase
VQLAGLPFLTKSTTGQAVNLVAHEHSYHPVRQRLEALTWDQVERLDDWLTDCFGVEKTEYAMAVGRMFLIGMFARIYEPGCQADYMPIFEGSQGIQKSSACRVLAGEWFSDSMPENIASKDASLHLRGKWLVEIAELHQFSRAETTALKAFITHRTDIYRPPYGEKEVHRPRQNLFVGTTNKNVYLQDSTGGRRFWPLVTTEIDLQTLIGQRDQLFAEALVRYRRGEHWWPTSKFESEHMMPEQEARFEGDAWEQPIAKYLDEKPNRDDAHPNGKTTVWEIARFALHFDTQRIGTADTRRITAILEHLGWRRGRRNGQSGTRWWISGLTH